VTTEFDLKPSTTSLVGRESAATLAWRTITNLQKGANWAWLDIVCQYRRSKIGPLWETINVIVMTAGLTVVSAAIFGGDLAGVIGYIGLGLIIWTSISALINEGANTFVRSQPYILNSNISIDLYVSRTVFKTLIVFAHHGILYFIALAAMLVPLQWASLLAIPGIALIFVNGFWVVTTLAFVCGRYRDLEPIIRNLLQLAMFATPILWNHTQIPKNRMYIVDYNVLFYFIEIVRGPLLGEVPPLRYYQIVLGVTVAGYVLAYIVYRWMRPRLAFFV
jgi:ABC-type polysaccharide/polyol phosphate export permease